MGISPHLELGVDVESDVFLNERERGKGHVEEGEGHKEEKMPESVLNPGGRSF